MSHAIPVFFLPVEGLKVGALQTAEGAQREIADAFRAREASGLRQATSTNWWHCFLTVELCKHWGIEGLEFLLTELRILAPAEVKAASEALAHLVARLKTDRLPLPDSALGPELAAMRDVPLADMIDSAVPTDTVHEGGGDLHSFIQFLTALRDVVLDARETDRHLLFYAPQP
jgi:hypothetical protein